MAQGAAEVYRCPHEPPPRRGKARHGTRRAVSGRDRPSSFPGSAPTGSQRKKARRKGELTAEPWYAERTLQSTPNDLNSTIEPLSARAMFCSLEYHSDGFRVRHFFGGVWHLHPIVRSADNPWNRLAAAASGIVRAVRDTSRSRRILTQPQRDTRAEIAREIKVPERKLRAAAEVA